MNYLDNDVRPERNRYIHDSWMGDGKSARRTNRSPKIERTQSRTSVLQLWTEREYPDVEQVGHFVRNLELLWDDLCLLDGHIAWLTDELKRPSGFQQPLPQEWRSLAHRDWRAPSKP
jgi:hypothetical protein